MKILIALDDAPVSARAARVAAGLFGRVPEAEFLVMNVATVSAPWVGAAGYGAVSPLVLDPRWVEGSADDDEDDERDLMAQAEAVGIAHPEVEVRSGDPVTEICAVADEHDVDVIVVGSHHKSALRRLVDPSVAAGVVRETYRPVLVVSEPPPAR